jgi:hypothetical protein
MPLAGLVLNRVHGSGASKLSAERALAAAENLDEGGIVDQTSGKTGVRDVTAASPSPESPAAHRTPGTDPAPEPDGASGPEPYEADDRQTTQQLTAGLLRLHAERMQVLAREQRTRDRFAALHPEVAVAEVAALPGDVHDLAGLRAIGDRLATGGRTPVGVA